MPRPKPQTIYALPGTTLPEARARLRPMINRLLSAANHGALPHAHPFERDAHRALLALSEGRALSVEWPALASEALVNILSNIQTGDYHLRRCEHCSLWMLVKDQRQNKCNRAGCDKRATAIRQARFRKNESDRNREALAAIRRTS